MIQLSTGCKHQFEEKKEQLGKGIWKLVFKNYLSLVN